MLAQLLEWVQMESPTTHKPSVDLFGQAVAAKFSEIGMTIETDVQPVRGNHLIARWGNPASKILMIGHLDTVWELGSLHTIPIRVENDIAHGPGIFDMKGGVIIALFALQLFREKGEAINLTLLLNSDEEEGSETSRDLIEGEARTATHALILEPAGPENALKTKRRGTGHYRVTSHGRAAHAGVEPWKGVNAIEELSHQILEIQSWNRQRKGISANVGLIQGGTRTNVVPALAEAGVDLRSDSPEDVEWLKTQFAGLKPKHPEAKLDIEGSFDRPPMVRSEQVIALYQKAERIAAAFDYPVKEFWTGGASDGNFTSALGIPTLDGLGPEGSGAHALTEQIIVSSLPKRANLLYHLLKELSG